MNNANKYRDLNRYRNQAQSRNDIPLSSNNISKSNLDYKTAQYSRGSKAKYSYKHVKKDHRARRRKNIITTAVVIVILLVGGIGAWKFWPIQVEVNGQQYTLTYDKSVGEAAKQADVKVKSGNFIAVDYSVLNPGEGKEYYAEINGKEVTNKDQLHNGDALTYTDGKDIMEEYTSEDSDISATAKITGTGAIHKFEGTGEPGTWSILHGKISGITTERQTKDPDNVVVRQVNIDPGKDKVIALTFDDGPSDEYTQEILDLLKKYDAHATFFVIGERLEESWGKKLASKEVSAGHQVCTHTYDHARPAGGTDMTGMSAEKQIKEITKGKEMIAKSINGDVSSVVRVPGGNLTTNTARLIAPFVTAEIGWNIDTGDWEMPGKDKILKNLKLASSGDVILCHDGGGDRSETVAALGEFLNEFTSKGYKFITVDEMMQYDEAKSKNNTTASTSKYTS